MAASKSVRMALCLSIAGVFIFFCFLIANMPTVVVNSMNNQKLIVVMMDGFGRQQLRHLMDTSDDGAFRVMAAHGVAVDYLRPIFPTFTLPNHYALMTGMYAEDHGVVHDTFYDRRTNEEFRFENKPSLWMANKWAEPVWLSVERNGQRVYLSTTQCHKSVPVLNISASCPSSSTDPKVQLTSFADNLKEAVDRLTSKKGDHVLAIVHTPLVHEVIHEHGPTSIETEEAVEKLDQILGMFLHGINDLESKINVILVSDVGLAPTFNKKPVFVNTNDMVKSLGGGGGHLCLWPNTNKEDMVLENLRRLKGIRAQTKNESHMLEKLHYRNHELIAPIQIVADDGYFIQLNSSKPDDGSPRHESHRESPKGLHGYDPFHVDHMTAIFYALGPKFEKGSQVRYLHTPVVYQIVRSVLGINNHHHHVHHPAHHVVPDGILKKTNGHHH